MEAFPLPPLAVLDAVVGAVAVVGDAFVVPVAVVITTTDADIEATDSAAVVAASAAFVAVAFVVIAASTRPGRVGRAYATLATIYLGLTEARDDSICEKGCSCAPIY